MSEKNTGRVTIPTNLDVVPETLLFPGRADKDRGFMQLTTPREKIMSGRRRTRMRCNIMSGFYTAVESELQIL